MGSPLKNPPVYLILAQARFNPILKLEEFLPDIQEGFRQVDYPDFRPRRGIQLAVKEDSPTFVPQDRFLFGNTGKTRNFIVDRQSLTLLSTDHDRFETFSTCFLEGLEIVHDTVRLAFTERIGLRYLDRVMPRSGETVRQYLVEQAHGLDLGTGEMSSYSYMESLNETGRIKLMSRVAIQNGPLAFPPDIQPGDMSIAERFTSYAGVSAIIDNDGFVEDRETFSTEAVTHHLDDIHEVIDAAFRAIATPYAFAAWDK
jgi:uncharacterized protein (TIGR04255 family)